MSWNVVCRKAVSRCRVTLHVSVWVEMCVKEHLSPLVQVTLHVSVWVEISIRACSAFSVWVTLHVSVWVEIDICRNVADVTRSRSTWACELKSASCSVIASPPSHAPRERVSWNLLWLQVRLFVTCHAPHERVGQFSFQRRTYWYWIIQVTAWLRSGGIFIPKYYTFFMCFPSKPPIHTPKFVQTNDL